MALRVGGVVVLVSLFGYTQVADLRERSIKLELEQFVTERSRSESQWFQFIVAKQHQWRDDFLARYRLQAESKQPPDLGRIFETAPDGAQRVRAPFFSGTHELGGMYARHLSGFAEVDAAMSSDFAHRHLAAFELLGQFGQVLAGGREASLSAGAPPFLNLYFLAPEKSLLIYWPGLRWSPGADYRFQGHEYYELGLPEVNPTRETRWTRIYLDEISQLWMTSCITPIDLDKRYLGAIGTDISLQRLIDGIYERHLPGTTAVLFRKDGRLIAHPGLADEIARLKGDFYIARDGDAALQDLYRLVTTATKPGVLNDTRHDRLVAAGRIAGPDWYLAVVYPKRLMWTSAIQAAGAVLLAGLLSLCVEVFLMGGVLRRKVAQPLKRLLEATRKVSRGDLSPQALQALPTETQDEIGTLAEAFAGMTQRLREARDTLEARVEQRTAELEEANAELSHQERQLQVQYEQLKELDRLKSNFVNSVSHELRTPLTTIRGYAEFLEEGIGGLLSSEQTRFVWQIQMASQRLEGLLNDLLDFARIEAGTFTLRHSEQELATSAQEIVESFRPLAEDARVTIRLEAPAHPLVAWVDPQRVCQVLTNLISNAVKFSPPGGVVRVRLMDDDEFVRCEVEDDGEGIAAVDMPRLFQRFSQLEAGLKKGKGTGLGLNISKVLVEAHGGTIGVQSAPGEGARFWFTLPKSPEAIKELA
ncbi:HAMP domain-containing protein [bacterium]|nr:HAMP domain-containing protein [bacterium]